MGVLRKSDLAARVASRLGTRAQGEAALNAVIEAITMALKAGDKVVVTGFGSFEVRQVKERQVRAIRGFQQGRLIRVPSHRRVGFTPGSELGAAVRGR
ncbi:MAG: HU family DNA-binding protein [Chloroflexi bacterium]|nr:HU family DNA-binding protein [Chloroflexota bacterium]